jgi:hypothetical protein
MSMTYGFRFTERDGALDHGRNVILVRECVTECVPQIRYESLLNPKATNW